MIRIAIPAWNEPYVDLAVSRTIPALRAALRGRPAQFDIHTDQPQAFNSVMDGQRVAYYPLTPHLQFHGTQAAAHRLTLATADQGDVIMMMNADVVASVDVFDQMERLMTGPIKCLAVLGLRTLSMNGPPVGVDANTLLDWSWKNRHPINEDCVWGRGRTSIPTLLFFEGPGGAVVAHCFHLHPMFIQKERELSFAGTIDSDLLAQFKSDEVLTVCNREMAFAEMSPETKMFRRAHSQLSAVSVIQFGRRRFTESHIEYFKKAIRITGDGLPDDSVVGKIVRGIRGGGIVVR